MKNKVQMNILKRYGLDDFFTKQLEDKNQEKFLGKVISGSKKSFRVITNKGEINCLVKGSLIHHKIADSSLLPKIGDFVLIDAQKEIEEKESYFIKRVLKRKNELKRKLVAKKHEDQVIASNLDYIFITISCDEQFNLRKIERLVVASIDGGIEPIFIITKTDLTNDVNFFTKQLESSFPSVRIMVTSIYDNSSINIIKDILVDNKIGAFIGNSGVGKSTLVNMILDSSIQKTSGVSEEKSKGKHTTTHRELFLLQGGGAIIDNPGIKEFGLWINNEDSIVYGFKEILELEKQCKFSNCSHKSEPNCKVQEAIASGELSQKKLDSFFKLKQEQQKDILLHSKHEKNKYARSSNKIIKQAQASKYDEFEEK